MIIKSLAHWREVPFCERACGIVLIKIVFAKPEDNDANICTKNTAKEGNI